MKTKRNAEIAVVAMYRVWATEGDFPLSLADIADRIGYKSINQLSTPVIDCMVMNGWVSPEKSGFQITDAGRAYATSLLTKEK